MDAATGNDSFSSAMEQFFAWFTGLLLGVLLKIMSGLLLGLVLQFLFARYVSTLISALKRRVRRKQLQDKPSNVTEAVSQYQLKAFLKR